MQPQTKKYIKIGLLIVAIVALILVVLQAFSITNIGEGFTLPDYFLGGVRFPAYSYLPKHYNRIANSTPLAKWPSIPNSYRPISGPPPNYLFNTIY